MDIKKDFIVLRNFKPKWGVRVEFKRLRVNSDLYLALFITHEFLYNRTPTLKKGKVSLQIAKDFYDFNLDAKTIFHLKVFHHIVYTQKVNLYYFNSKNWLAKGWVDYDEYTSFINYVYNNNEWGTRDIFISEYKIIECYLVNNPGKFKKYLHAYTIYFVYILGANLMGDDFYTSFKNTNIPLYRKKKYISKYNFRNKPYH